MPAYIKAYVAVMVLSLIALALLKRVFTPDIIGTADFQRRARMWLLITSVAFLSSNFWVYAVLCVIVAARASRAEPNRLALFVALVFAVPPLTRLLPGFGPIEYILPINHEHLLNYALLCPYAISLYKERHSRPRGPRAPDFLVAMYIVYMVVSFGIQSNAQSTIRMAFNLLTDIGIVYYVASRSLTSMRAYREVAAALVVGLAIVALVAVFETTKSWWLYESLGTPFGARGAGYISRGDLNLLRAKASLGHPIVLGLAMGMALMLVHSFSTLIKTGRHRLLLIGLLFGALLVSFSRGPWVGAFVGMLYLLSSGQRKGKRLVYTLGASAVVVGILAVTPFGQSLFTMLPFVGPADSGSVLYRQKLWDVSIVVWKQNLWLGDLQYLKNPLMEVMRQGEGIIDMVNSYLQIGLAYGLIGVGLFLGCVFACWRCAKSRLKSAAPEAVDADHIRTALRATLVVILVTIGTVSNISFVPLFTWLVLGLCAGLPRMHNLHAASTQAKGTRTQM
jgi:O-antigen ligase